MSTLTPRRRVEARVRRVVSLVLSGASAVIMLSNIVIFFVRPSTFTDGTFGLAPVLAILVNALFWAPVAAIAAMLVVGTMPSAATTSPPVDRLPRRLPMRAAVISLCLVGACILALIVMVIASLVLPVFSAVF